MGAGLALVTGVAEDVEADGDLEEGLGLDEEGNGISAVASLVCVGACSALVGSVEDSRAIGRRRINGDDDEDASGDDARSGTTRWRRSVGANDMMQGVLEEVVRCKGRLWKLNKSR